MGEAPKHGDGTDPSGAGDATLLDAIKVTEGNARAPRATVKGMVPLQRAPALVGSDPSDE